MKGYLIILAFVFGAVFVAAFFGWLASSKAFATGVSMTGFAAGVLILLAILVLIFGEDWGMSTARFLVAAILVFKGWIVMLAAPVVGATAALADGKPYEGPYQKMDGAQRQAFWNGVRKVGKSALTWYAKREKRKGNEDTASAARAANKFF